MNTRLIQQIEIWSPTGQRTIDRFSLTNFYGYNFSGGAGYVDYSLIGIQGEIYFNGVVEIPATIVQQWGASDDIIFDYVATILGLIIVN